MSRKKLKKAVLPEIYESIPGKIFGMTKELCYMDIANNESQKK
jgi:hypothetical protein